MKEEKEMYSYKGLLYEYRSKEELYFSWYLDELVERGFVLKYEYELYSFDLFDKQDIDWFELKKTKDVKKSFTLFNPMTYTPDFKITWSSKAIGVFVGSHSVKRTVFHPSIDDEIEGTVISYVDVKGDVLAHQGSSNYGAFSFPYKQKLMWLKFRIYTHKIVPIKLFRDTFTPSRYLLTDGGGTARKVTIGKNVKDENGKSKKKRVEMTTYTLDDFTDKMKPKWFKDSDSKDLLDFI